MSRIFRFLFIIVLLVAAAPVASAKAEDLTPPNTSCIPFQNPTHPIEIYLICPPAPPAQWNNDLVIFVHGYVDPRRPVDIPYDQLVMTDGTTTIPGIVTGLGYAFATTSFRKNGLAVTEGVQDVLGLVEFIKTIFPVNHIYLIGASEGGLITTLLVEQNPTIFNGGVAMCGPVGDFNKQVDYWGDFRVLFDYFFPNLLSPSPVYIPADAIDGWSTYDTGIIGGYPVPIEKPGPLQLGVAIALKSALPRTIAQLINTSKAPIDLFNPVKSTGETILGILRYNMVATNEGREELNGGSFDPETNLGQPFDNMSPLRLYTGSFNDKLLNKKVQRFSADQPAKDAIAAGFQTSGILSIPLVTLHTTGDPIVPYWHEDLYKKKLAPTSVAFHSNIKIFRYGHCNFKPSEAVFAFYVMIYKASHKPIPQVNFQAFLKKQEAREEFKKLVEQFKKELNITPADQ